MWSMAFNASRRASSFGRFISTQERDPKSRAGYSIRRGKRPRRRAKGSSIGLGQRTSFGTLICTRTTDRRPQYNISALRVFWFGFLGAPRPNPSPEHDQQHFLKRAFYRAAVI